MQAKCPDRRIAIALALEERRERAQGLAKIQSRSSWRENSIRARAMWRAEPALYCAHPSPIAMTKGHDDAKL